MSSARYKAVPTEEDDVFASESLSMGGSTGLIARKMSEENRQENEPVLTMRFDDFIAAAEQEKKKEKTTPADAAIKATQRAKAAAEKRMITKATETRAAAKVEETKAAAKTAEITATEIRRVTEAKAAEVRRVAEAEAPVGTNWSWGEVAESITTIIGSGSLMFPLPLYYSPSGSFR